MRDLRGREISMIFQNPRAALNPIRKVGHQIEDVLLAARQAAPSDAAEKAIEHPRAGPHRAAARALSRLSVRAVAAACASASSSRWRWPAGRSC